MHGSSDDGDTTLRAAMKELREEVVGVGGEPKLNWHLRLRLRNRVDLADKLRIQLAHLAVRHVLQADDAARDHCRRGDEYPVARRDLGTDDNAHPRAVELLRLIQKGRELLVWCHPAMVRGAALHVEQRARRCPLDGRPTARASASASATCRIDNGEREGDNWAMRISFLAAFVA